MNKNNKRPYHKINQEARDMIIEMHLKKHTVSKISVHSQVKASTVKAILKIFQLEGRSVPKIFKPRKIKSNIFNSKIIAFQKEIIAENKQQPPQQFFASYENQHKNKKKSNQIVASYKNAILKQNNCDELKNQNLQSSKAEEKIQQLENQNLVVSHLSEQNRYSPLKAQQESCPQFNSNTLGFPNNNNFQQNFANCIQAQYFSIQ